MLTNAVREAEEGWTGGGGSHTLLTGSGSLGLF